MHQMLAGLFKLLCCLFLEMREIFEQKCLHPNSSDRKEFLHSSKGGFLVNLHKPRKIFSGKRNRSGLHIYRSAVYFSRNCVYLLHDFYQSAKVQGYSFLSHFAHSLLFPRCVYYWVLLYECLRDGYRLHTAVFYY